MVAVFRAQGESRIQMGDGHVRISLKRVRNRQSVLDVILVGLQLVGLPKVFNGASKVPGIQTGDPQGVVLVGGFGSGSGTASSLPAKTQMHLCSFCHIASINIYQFFKDFRRFVVILLLKRPDAQLKTPDGSLVGNIGVRSLRT